MGACRDDLRKGEKGGGKGGRGERERRDAEGGQTQCTDQGRSPGFKVKSLGFKV